MQTIFFPHFHKLQEDTIHSTQPIHDSSFIQVSLRSASSNKKQLALPPPTFFNNGTQSTALNTIRISPFLHPSLLSEPPNKSLPNSSPTFSRWDRARECMKRREWPPPYLSKVAEENAALRVRRLLADETEESGGAKIKLQ